jgi:hypothetical protein
MKTNIYSFVITILLAIIIAILLFFWSRLSIISDSNTKQIDDLKKSIIASDVLTKEAEGRYSKLVDYYSKHSELLSDLNKLDKNLYSIVKSQDERLLNISKAVISFSSKLDSGIVIESPKDTNQLDLKLAYPTLDSPFINWSGYINKHSSKYYGNWTFNKLPINIVVTEESRGLWKHRIVGPDWIKVDSLSVKSIPPQEYVPIVEKKIQFMFGVNYLADLKNMGNIGVFGVGVGLSYDHYHTILLSINNNQQLGFGYYYKFRSFKNKK